MKKQLLGLSVCAMLLMSSCTTMFNSAKEMEVSTPTVAASLADLEISNKKVTYTMYPRAEVRRGGFKNVVNTAVREALAQNGGGDILVEMQITYTKKKGLFGSKISSMTVSGYPASFKNFRSADDATLKGMLVK